MHLAGSVCEFLTLILRRRRSLATQWAVLDPEATGFANPTLVGHRVALVTDPTQDRTDRYGRILAYFVRADGWNYSVEAARAGAAKSYVYGGVPVTEHGAIEAAQREAESAQLGRWGLPCFGNTASQPF